MSAYFSCTSTVFTENINFPKLKPYTESNKGIPSTQLSDLSHNLEPSFFNTFFLIPLTLSPICMYFVL